MSRKLSKLIADFESSLVGRMLSDNPRTEKNYKAARKELRTALSEAERHIPRLSNCGTYLAKDNKGQWHYINHANSWCACPDPIRALIPSEPHDAEVKPSWQDPSIFGDAEGRN